MQIIGNNLWIRASNFGIVGSILAVLAVAGIAYALYKYFTPKYCDEFDDDFEDDDFDDDFFEDTEE